MRTIEIYHLEDEERKRRWLGTIVDRLNARGQSDQVRFIDRLGPSWDKLKGNPSLLAQTIWDGAGNENAIFLLDVVLISPDSDPARHQYREAANLITAMLSDEGLDQVVLASQRLLSILKSGQRVEDVKLAAVTAALCQYRNTRFAWASTNTAWLRDALPPEFRTVPSFSFPLGEDVDVDPLLIERATDVIYELAVCSSLLNPQEFLEKAVDLGHPEGKEKAAAVDLLRLFLRMSKTDFLSTFGGDGDIHANVLEGIKSMSGARSGLDLQAAWLLALGVYRSLFPAAVWQSKWNAEEFCRYPTDREYFIAHSVKETEDEAESRATRLSTLRAYTDLCERLFRHDEQDDTDLLVGTRLGAKSLEFTVDIPFQRFRDTLVQVFRKARGENIDFGKRAHDTSSAVLRFLISSLFKVEADDVIISPNASLRISGEDGRTHVKFG